MNKKQEPLIAYLSYLRDISRKIISNTGFEKAYISKVNRGMNANNFIYDVTNGLNIPTQDLLKFSSLNEKEPTKRLFIGLGIIIGELDDKLIGGPVVYLECEVSSDDDKLRFEVSPIINSFVVNNDLLSMIIKSQNPIFEDEDNSQSDYYYNIKLMGMLEDFLINNIKYGFNIKELINNISSQLLTLKKQSSAFESIDFENGDAIDRISELMACKSKKQQISIFNGLKYYPNALTFVAKVPDQLSTYEVINCFIDSINSDRRGFVNETLAYLLLKAFDVPTEKLPELESIDVTKTINNFLPTDLSKSQKKAMDLVWNSHISYIQGPPGTGKSYTIFNIALMAHLLSKKVLIVSQKTPALYILPKFVKTNFRNDTVQDNLLKIYNYEDRDSLKKSIEYLEREVSDFKNNNKNVELLQKQFNEIEAKLNNKLAHLRKLESTYEAILDIEHRAKGFHDKLVEARITLENEHSIHLKSYELLTVAERITEINRAYNISKELVFMQPNYRTALFLSKVQDFFLQYNNDIEITLRNVNAIMSLFNSFCSNYLFYLNEKMLILQDSDVLLYEIDRIRVQIKSIQKDLLTLSIQIKLRENLSDKFIASEVSKLKKLLYHKKRTTLDTIINKIDFNEILEVFPVWVSEIRNCNLFFPVENELFDLVVIDEASQVNLAEIIPVLYRAKRICIVGDHKQLSLDSTGLTFHLSKSFDELSWNKHFKKHGELKYSDADGRSLTVMKSSILDFIRNQTIMFNVPEVMLNEHYRSHPLLAKFTSDTFYKDDKNSNGLSIMTANYEKSIEKAFYVVKTQGKRNDAKVIKEECDTIVDILSKLVNRRPIEFIPDNLMQKKDLTIGVLSFMRNQCEYIREAIEIPISPQLIEKHELMIGTAEEFQGNERDIMILSFSLNSGNRKSRNFYESETRRFNVATSRARLFTIAIYSGIPDNFPISRKYFKHFMGNDFSTFNDEDLIEYKDDVMSNSCLWSFSEVYESELEMQVYRYLLEYSIKRNANIAIYNQIVTCGQKRLDFVLVNKDNNTCVAVEVDGAYHFLKDKPTYIYHAEHIERITSLKRAGWNIINTPFYKWYNKGWLSELNSTILSTELRRIYHELDNYLKCDDN